MSKRIALIGGWTGGHITPIIALTRFIKSEHPEVGFLWIWEANSMEARFAQEEHIPFESIISYRIPAMRSLKMIPALFRLVRWIFDARVILKKFAPDSLFSKGGPGAISVVLAAKLLSIPVYLHDSDVIPGISNRFVARFATRIFLGCEEAKTYFPKTSTETIGQLLNPELIAKNPNPDIAFWSTDKTRVLVICGSQWSTSIYTELVRIIPELPEFEFIISLGTRNEGFAEQFADFSNARAEPWLGKDLGSLYRKADVVISRGSITTLAEAAAFGAKVVAIPLPIAAFDHQRANVRAYEVLGYAKGLEETELSKLSDMIRSYAGRRTYAMPRYDILEGVRKVANKLT